MFVFVLKLFLHRPLPPPVIPAVFCFWPLAWMFLGHLWMCPTNAMAVWIRIRSQMEEKELCHYIKVIATDLSVCVCVELLKRSKTCTSITLAIFWQYMNLFRGAALTSGFSHVHLLIFLCLLKQFYPICSTILAGGASSSFSLAPTKTLNAAGDIEADHFDVPANTWDNLWHGDLVETLVMRASFLGFCFKLLVPTHWRWNMHHYHELGTERAISLI